MHASKLHTQKKNPANPFSCTPSRSAGQHNSVRSSTPVRRLVLKQVPLVPKRQRGASYVDLSINCVPEFVSKGDRKSVPLQQTLKRNVGAPRESHLASWNPGSSHYGGPRESVTAQPRFLLQTWALFLLHVPVTHNQFLLLPILPKPIVAPRTFPLIPGLFRDNEGQIIKSY